MMTEQSKRKQNLTALGLNSRATDEMRIREMMRLEVDRLRRLQWAGNEKENRAIRNKINKLNREVERESLGEGALDALMDSKWGTMREGRRTRRNAGNEKAYKTNSQKFLPTGGYGNSNPQLPFIWGWASVPKYSKARKFGNRRYWLAGITKDKSNKSRKVAYDHAENLRSVGYNARIVNWKGNYGIYVNNSMIGYQTTSKGEIDDAWNARVLAGKTTSIPSIKRWDRDRAEQERMGRQNRLTGFDSFPDFNFNYAPDKVPIFNFKIKQKGNRKYNASRSDMASMPQLIKPSMLVIGEELIPFSQSNNYSSEYGDLLDDEQKRGVDMMLSSLLDREDSNLGTTDGGFLLADGTGFGKTRQLLSVADQWVKETGSKVLIVTENKETIEGSFFDDAEALGIDLDQFEITTYTEIGGPSKRAKQLLDEKYGLVIYDEAHNMKNILSPRAEIATGINSEKAVFATATPLDTAGGGAYFLSKVTGIPEERVQESLGLKLMTGAGGMKYWDSVLTPREVNARLAQYRSQLIENGLMMRRVHPFYGNIISTSVPMQEGVKAEQDDIVAYWRQFKQTPSIKGQTSLELQRWEESHKVPAIYENMKESLEEGKQVVIAVGTSGEQAFKGLSRSRESTYEDTVRRIKQLDKRSILLDGKKSGLIPVQRMVEKPQMEWADQDQPEYVERWFPGRKGASQMLKEMLIKDGIPFSELTQEQKGIDQVNDFQSGKTKVMIMTAVSGGTGINLDDRTGESPRHLIIGTKGWAGDKMEQLLGRVSRKTTQTPSLAEIVGLTGGFADSRQTSVLKRKLSALRSITGTDIYGLRAYDEEWGQTIKDRENNNRLRESVVKPMEMVTA